MLLARQLADFGPVGRPLDPPVGFGGHWPPKMKNETTMGVPLEQAWAGPWLIFFSKYATGCFVTQCFKADKFVTFPMGVSPTSRFSERRYAPV